MVYLITYDLNKTKDYERLYTALKALGDWIRDNGLDSVWFVSTHLSADQISEKLRGHIDSDDNVFVTRLHSGGHAGWMHKDIWPWLSSRI